MNTIIENIILFFQKLGEIIHSFFHKKEQKKTDPKVCFEFYSLFVSINLDSKSLKTLHFYPITRHLKRQLYRYNNHTLHLMVELCPGQVTL